jgi:hypothetical protein
LPSSVIIAVLFADFDDLRANEPYFHGGVGAGLHPGVEAQLLASSILHLCVALPSFVVALLLNVEFLLSFGVAILPALSEGAPVRFRALNRTFLVQILVNLKGI